MPDDDGGGGRQRRRHQERRRSSRRAGVEQGGGRAIKGSQQGTAVTRGALSGTRQREVGSSSQSSSCLPTTAMGDGRRRKGHWHRRRRSRHGTFSLYSQRPAQLHLGAAQGAPRRMPGRRPPPGYDGLPCRGVGEHLGRAPPRAPHVDNDCLLLPRRPVTVHTGGEGGRATRAALAVNPDAPPPTEWSLRRLR